MKFNDEQIRREEDIQRRRQKDKETFVLRMSQKIRFFSSGRRSVILVAPLFLAESRESMHRFPQKILTQRTEATKEINYEL